MLKILLPLMLLNFAGGTFDKPNYYRDPISGEEIEDFDLNNVYYNSTYGERGSLNNILDTCGIYYNKNLNNAVQIDTCCDYEEAYGTKYATLAIKTVSVNLENKNCKITSIADQVDADTTFKLNKGKDGWYYAYAPIMDGFVTLPLDNMTVTINKRMYVAIYKENVVPEDKFYVNDNIAPVLYGTLNKEFNTTSFFKISKEEILKGFSAFDTFDFNPTIEVIGYEDYLNDLSANQFNLKVVAKDNAGNQSNIINVKINQKDESGPLIVGPSKIYKGVDKIFTTDEIKSLYEVIDVSDFTLEFVDGDSDGKKQYLKNASKPGNYNFRLIAKDAYENSGTKLVDISVSKTLAPVIYFEDIVLVDSNVKLELIDFVNLLKTSGEVNIDLTNEYQVVEDNYTDNSLVSGTFDYKLKIRSSNGESKIKEFKVKVSKVNFEYKENYKKTFINHISDFFKSIGDWFWVNIFRPIAKLFGYKGN